MLMWSLSGNTFFQGRFLFPTQWNGIWGSEGKPPQVIQCIRAYFSKKCLTQPMVFPPVDIDGFLVWVIIQDGVFNFHNSHCHLHM